MAAENRGKAARPLRSPRDPNPTTAVDGNAQGTARGAVGRARGGESQDVGRGEKDPLASSVGKALAVLNALAAASKAWEPSRIGVTELARSAGLPKSTAFRLLSILGQAGLVEREGTGYRLGRRLFELGALVTELKPQSLRDAALPYLEDLYELSHETVHLGVLDGTEVLYLEKIHGHNPANSPSRVGGRLPAHCVGLGKAMLAYSPAGTVRAVLDTGLPPLTPHSIVYPNLLLNALAGVRKQGVAFDIQEARLGLTCVAAPVLDPNGHAVAAVSISGPTYRFNPTRFTSPVREAVKKISAEIKALNPLRGVPC
jgi:DNA-binding IclR family transcriptional regulator